MDSNKEEALKAANRATELLRESEELLQVAAKEAGVLERYLTIERNTLRYIVRYAKHLTKAIQEGGVQ